jgi:hypothetical protein
MSRTTEDFTVGDGSTLPLRPLASASTGAHLNLWERDDPFYAPGIFEGSGPWWCHWKIEPSPPGDPVGTRKVPDFSTDTTLMRRMAGLLAAQRVVAALAGWHQLSSKQLSAIVGYPFTKLSRILKPLFELGIVERGHYPKEQVFLRTDYLYRLRIDKPLRTFLGLLDDETRYSVTLGIAPVPAGAAVRHDLLAAEFAIRALELIPGVVAVFPESVSSPSLLLRHLGRKETWRGDLTLLRSDGLRIVIEITRARHPGEIEFKMRRWGRLLMTHNWHETGLMVVFVNAAVPNSGLESIEGEHRMQARLLRDTYTRALSQECLSSDEVRAMWRHLARARAQIHLASWMDWFPAPGLVSGSFPSLPTVFNAGDGRWRRRGLSDPNGFWDFDPWPRTARIVNAHLANYQKAYSCPRFRWQPAANRSLHPVVSRDKA